MADKHFIDGAVPAVMHLETDGTLHVEHVQDVEPILEYTQAARNNRYSGMSGEGFVGHVAEIPFVVAMRWAQEAGVRVLSPEWEKIAEQKLRDPDWRNLLAAPTLRDPHIIMRGSR